jgi:NAD-dependent DNA ligase
MVLGDGFKSILLLCCFFKLVLVRPKGIDNLIDFFLSSCLKSKMSHEAIASIKSLTKLEKFLGKMTVDDLKNLKEKLDDAYAIGDDEFLVEDWKYDVIVETIEDMDESFVRPTGVKIRDARNRVMLPYTLGSMDKFKPNNEAEIKRWVDNNPADEYVIMSKLDGISCLITIVDGDAKLFTRGDGSEGGDITHMLPYLKLPKNLPDMALRGEIIMKKATFDKKHSREKKSSEGYANPRNMAAGLTGAKTSRDGMSDLEFIAYEIVADEQGEPRPPIKSQLDALKKLKFKVVKHELVESFDVQSLLNFIIRFKEEETFEIDGIIVQANGIF